MRRLVAGVAVAIAIAVILVAPVVPSKAVSYTSTSPTTPSSPIETPCCTWSESDPTGSRGGGSFANGTYTMSLSTYNTMLHDPYSHWCSSNDRFVGDTVYLTCPPSNVTSGNSLSANSGFESGTCWLMGHGGLYFDGRYIWK